jgi:alpha-tubulin suppressor-like RCC1 family protein
MTHTAYTPFLASCSGPTGGRRRRFTRRLAPVVASALLVPALGCREDAESPTAPEPEPALDITPAHALSFRQVSAGGGHTCGVTTDDRAFCWGNNLSGQLGAGPVGDFSLTPVTVAGGLRFRSVSVGSHHTCGVTTNSRAYCWGDNSVGQLGNGTTSFENPTPVAVSGGLQFRQVSAASFHTCGVTTDDRAFCWGLNHQGQLGDGTTNQRLRPARVVGGLPFRQVSAGQLSAFAATNTCGVTTSNVAYCWGSNFFGQLGIGSRDEEPHPRPVAVVGGRRFRQVSVGAGHTCGLTPANRAFCWGLNSDAQLGDNSRTNRLEPVHVHAQGLEFLQIRGGGRHTCGVATSNVVYCWGRNVEGQLGNGTTFRRPLPTAVADGRRFRQVSAGAIHTCAVTVSNRAFCWGNNFFGQLGDGTRTDRLVPVPVAGAT